MEGRDYVTVTYGKDPDDDSTYGIGITAFSDARVQALEDAVRRGILHKPERHHLTERSSDTPRNMNQIGG